MCRARWVRTKHQNFQKKNKLGLDRKIMVDEIGFAWKKAHHINDKLWHEQYEQLVEFIKRKKGHYLSHIIGKGGRLAAGLKFESHPSFLSNMRYSRTICFRLNSHSVRFAVA
jgi:hypothetical protein